MQMLRLRSMVSRTTPIPFRFLSSNNPMIDSTSAPTLSEYGHPPKRTNRDFDGIVVSDKMQKSIVVAVTRFRVHPKYNKRLRYTRKFMAHDEEEVCEIGDKVRITMSKPISKRKRFKLLFLMEKVKKL
uniref:Small ribosomal subunit protein uS17c n=1 Tax=Octactis speculum TaxID=3111310 RepID=A0A7S2H311_9STRA